MKWIYPARQCLRLKCSNFSTVCPQYLIMTAHWCKSLIPFTLQLPILNLNMCVSWVIRQTLNVFLFKHCLHLSFTYSTALLYTSMALSVSPASRCTFPSIKKVLSCLFNCRAVFRCSSAWQRHNISFIKSVASICTVYFLRTTSRLTFLKSLMKK